jgi:hypothetical protein
MKYRQNRPENYSSDCPSPHSQASKSMIKSTSATIIPRETGSRHSLTNKPGVVFLQPAQKQPKPPAKAGVHACPNGLVLAKKAVLEYMADENNVLPYRASPTKGQPANQLNSLENTARTVLPYPTTRTVCPQGHTLPKSPTGPVAAASAKLQAKSLPAPGTLNAKKKGQDVPLAEMSPNKQAITKQFANEIEKAFNRLPSPEKIAKPVPKHDIILRDAVQQPSYRSARPLPLIPMRPAPVPIALQSPHLIGSRSSDLPAQQFPSEVRSQSIAPSMVSPAIYQDMFEDAPDDESSASSYDLTRPLRVGPSKQHLEEKRMGHFPVLPFRSPAAGSVPTPALILQQEPSILRISSYVTPRPANPLLHAPTLDKRNVSAPAPRIPDITSPVLVERDFQHQRPAPVRRHKAFRHEFFKEESMKEPEMSNYRSSKKIDHTPHPLQARLNSMMEPVPVKRKWSSRLQPGGSGSIAPTRHQSNPF